MAVICARSWEPSTLLQGHEGGAPVTRKRESQRLRRRGVSRKNQALRRWLVRFAAQPDDRGQQWWEHFDALLRRRPRMRQAECSLQKVALRNAPKRRTHGLPNLPGATQETAA